MDPMARKMNVHMDELHKALEVNDSSATRYHLNEITKYADFLQSDLTREIRKSEATPIPEGVEQFAGGVPVMKFNEDGTKFDTTQRDRVIPGTIISARTNPNMRNVTGTFGRWSN
tara:strand:+ start:8388 stop:8732 length:345 start_codon:yes stop_codon:yes gene_type:complete